MKVIIAGTRTMVGDGAIESVRGAVAIFIDAVGPITEVVCGGAPGIDTAGRRWAEANGIPVKMFEADWEQHGKSAGPIRNRQMAQYARGLILIWNGKSSGSKNMLEVADELGLATMSIALEASR